jgi:predicted RNase H-like HicB family nuclease
MSTEYAEEHPGASRAKGRTVMATDQQEPVVLSTGEGTVDGYRVIYEQLVNNWCAYAPDLPGVITTGKTLAETEQNMRGAVPFHLEGLEEDRRERPWLSQ